MGMKLKFLFRSLYVPKENDCFDKFTTFPDGSDLYLNSVLLTDRYWFEYGLLRWRPPGCFYSYSQHV